MTSKIYLYAGRGGEQPAPYSALLVLSAGKTTRRGLPEGVVVCFVVAIVATPISHRGSSRQGLTSSTQGVANRAKFIPYKFRNCGIDNITSSTPLD